MYVKVIASQSSVVFGTQCIYAAVITFLATVVSYLW